VDEVMKGFFGVHFIPMDGPDRASVPDDGDLLAQQQQLGEVG
jgi:hypothetical protein